MREGEQGGVTCGSRTSVCYSYPDDKSFRAPKPPSPVQDCRGRPKEKDPGARDRHDVDGARSRDGQSAYGPATTSGTGRGVGRDDAKTEG